VNIGTRTARRRAVRGALAALGAAGAVLASAPAPVAASSGCDRVAAPTGADTALGSESAPYRTAQKLVASLSAGQTGCLRQGTYGGSALRVEDPGVTLRSYPGERATITAFLEVYPEAVAATVTELKFDSAGNGNGTGVKIQADGAVFSRNELTKGGQGICLIAGSWNDAQDVVIERNRIYNCGPADSKYDHQLYLVHTRRAVVRWNAGCTRPPA
jgi:hypothetical protein